MTCARFLEYGYFKNVGVLFANCWNVDNFPHIFVAIVQLGFCFSFDVGYSCDSSKI